MKDDGGIQDITTKYFCWNAFYSLFFLVLWLGRVKRLHKQENKPVCLHNVKVFRSTRTKNCQTTGTGIGDRDPRRWQYNLMGHHPPHNFLKTFKQGSSRFLKVLQGSLRFPKVPYGSLRFLKVPQGSSRFLKIPQDKGEAISFLGEAIYQKKVRLFHFWMRLFLFTMGEAVSPRVRLFQDKVTS